MSASKRGNTKITRLLLNRNADPNQARTDTGLSPLMLAAINGHLEVAQLLVVHGGCICMAARTTTRSPTFGQLAIRKNNLVLARWFGAVHSWHPLRIAVGCRLHADARTVLRLGCPEPMDATAAERVAMAGTAADAR